MGRNKQEQSQLSIGHRPYPPGYGTHLSIYLPHCDLLQAISDCTPLISSFNMPEIFCVCAIITNNSSVFSSVCGLAMSESCTLSFAYYCCSDCDTVYGYASGQYCNKRLINYRFFCKYCFFSEETSTRFIYGDLYKGSYMELRPRLRCIIESNAGCIRQDTVEYDSSLGRLACFSRQNQCFRLPAVVCLRPQNVVGTGVVSGNDLFLFEQFMR